MAGYSIPGSVSLPGPRAGQQTLFDRVASALALLLFLPLALLTVGRMRRVLLAVIILDIPLQLDTHLAYRPELAGSGALGGFGISLTTLALAGLYAGWALEGLSRRSSLRAEFRFSIALALYVLFTALSLLVARDLQLASYELWLLVQSLLLFIYVANAVRNPAGLMFCMRMLLVGMALQGALILALNAGLSFSLDGLSPRVHHEAVGEFARIGGTLGSPNTAGGYFSLLLAPALALLLAPVSRWDKRLALLAAGLGTAALVVTFSRGGWAAFLISLVVMAVTMWKRGWLRLRTPLLAMAALLLVALVFHAQIATRIFGGEAATLEGRFYLMQIAMRIIAENPVLGVGANNFSLAMAAHFPAGDWFYVVHNKYLLVWAEVGLLGLLCFLAFLLATLRRGWRVWQGGDPLLAPLALGMTAAILGHMGHLVVDLFRDRPGVQLLWLLAALLLAAAAMHRRSAFHPGERLP